MIREGPLRGMGRSSVGHWRVLCEALEGPLWGMGRSCVGHGKVLFGAWEGPVWGMGESCVGHWRPMEGPVALYLKSVVSAKRKKYQSHHIIMEYYN